MYETTFNGFLQMQNFSHIEKKKKKDYWSKMLKYPGNRTDYFMINSYVKLISYYTL